MPLLSITIPTTHTEPEPKPHTVYALHVLKSLRTSIIYKRYSDFATLHSQIISETGSPPPASLPPKSWLGGFLGGGTKDSQAIEVRREGLETYLRAIANANDSRWRESSAFKRFLELEPTNKGGAGSKRPLDEILSAAEWLDVYGELKRKLQDARMQLTRREQATSAGTQHEAAVAAKKHLVSAVTLITRLDEGLKRFAAADSGKGDSWDEEVVERLGEGEVRRRRDLLGAATKEREGLEAVLNSMAVKSAIAASSMGAGMSGAAAESDTRALFRGASSSIAQPSSGRRVLGAPLPETTRTRELDNQGVLQLQKQIMEEQDQDVEFLTKGVRKMKEMGIQINEELALQTELLEGLENDVERVDGKIRVAKKRAEKIR